MLLVASMSFFVVACGGNDSVTNNEINQDNNDSSTDTSNDETENDYAKIISEESSYWANFHGDAILAFYEDNSYGEANSLRELGTWEINDNMLTIISEDNDSTCYEIKEINGVCFLIGNNEIFYNGNLDESEFPIKEVEIAIDNWQEYFEISTCTVENVDIFGEVTETSECYLKLKDEYFKYLINSCGSLCSEIALKYERGPSNTNETYMSLQNNFSVFGEPWGETYELVKIQGTLYFIDIE